LRGWAGFDSIQAFGKKTYVTQTNNQFAWLGLRAASNGCEFSSPSYSKRANKMNIKLNAFFVLAAMAVVFTPKAAAQNNNHTRGAQFTKIAAAMNHSLTLRSDRRASYQTINPKET
jgi:hypothetical protein